jgi:hypothetical protein
VEQAINYYRDEWLVEHGFHRFKKGSLPALPLFLHLDERIRGLMVTLGGTHVHSTRLLALLERPETIYALSSSQPAPIFPEPPFAE